jgi:hypothetical protein
VAGGAPLAGCGDTTGKPLGAAVLRCGGIDAIERPAAGELTCVEVVGVSSLDLASVVFGPNPNAFRHVVPSTKYTPIAAPNATAKVSETSHQGFHGEGGGRHDFRLERLTPDFYIFFGGRPQAHSRKIAFCAGTALLVGMAQRSGKFAFSGSSTALLVGKTH